MIAAINLNQVASTTQAAPVYLFNYSPEAEARLKQLQADNEDNQLCFVEVVISSVHGVDAARKEIQAAVKARLNALGWALTRRIICAPFVNDKGVLALEIWNQPA